MKTFFLVSILFVAFLGIAAEKCYTEPSLSKCEFLLRFKELWRMLGYGSEKHWAKVWPKIGGWTIGEIGETVSMEIYKRMGQAYRNCQCEGRVFEGRPFEDSDLDLLTTMIRP